MIVDGFGIVVVSVCSCLLTGCLMIKPVVHLNGTSADDLLSQLKSASGALREAYKALQQAAPNGRDYYVISSDAIQQATDEHRSRLERIDSVKREIDEIAVYVYAQKR